MKISNLGKLQTVIFKREKDVPELEWHVIPCKHNYSGPAPVSQYFISSDLENNQKLAGLYGNRLIGETVNTKGFLTKAKPGKEYNLIAQTNGTCTYWNKDEAAHSGNNWSKGVQAVLDMNAIINS